MKAIEEDQRDGVIGLLRNNLVLYVANSLDALPHYRMWVDLLGGAAISVASQAELVRCLRFYTTTKIVVVIDDERLNVLQTLDCAIEARKLRPDITVIAVVPDGMFMKASQRYQDVFVCCSSNSLFEFITAMQSALDCQVVAPQIKPIQAKVLNDFQRAGLGSLMIEEGPDADRWPEGWWIVPFMMLGLCIWLLIALLIFG